MNILTAWLRHYLPELAISDRQLADDLTLRGIAVEGVHDLGLSANGVHNGHLFEMDITTNRVDAMNHYGIAREAATIYNLPLAPLDAALPAAVAGAKPFSVEIREPELCGRFTARVLRGVTIAPSAGRVAEYFALLGAKPIWNAVDASNFVLQGMGHPTHAFDLDKIEGGIVVRLARKGERLKLLDGTERTLEPDDLVVADHVKALGLAGLMGGWDSMITAETKNVLVEAAWFDPASVRRSSRRHGLHTDASHRFERGADFNACAVANALVVKLILQAGGTVEGDLVDVVTASVAARTADRAPIELAVAEVQRHLGTTLEDKPGRSALTGELIRQYLTALGCGLAERATTGSKPAEIFSVKLPSWRLDLERGIDLVEEVARVYGYNRFANTLPAAMPVIAHPLAAAEAAVRARLLALGYSEAISSSFASEADGDTFGGKGRGVIALGNPLSEEARLLRPSLTPGMIGMLAHNLNRDVREVRLFEQGAVFSGSAETVDESAQLSLGVADAQPQALRAYTMEAPLFFELKGVVESLLRLFDLEGSAVTFGTAAPGWLEVGRRATALLGDRPIAVFGELGGAERDARKLRQPVFLAEIDLAGLYRLPLRRTTAREISRFQAVERDFSFVMPDAVAWGATASAIEGLGIFELQSVKPVEVWRDRKKYPGFYSLLVRVVFQSNERTLREDELTEWSARVIAALTSLGGTIRS